MITTEDLKQMLRNVDYTLVHADDDTEDRWEDPAGHTMIFEEACKIGLNRCTCCGEIIEGPSAACNARHENKDCNCFPQKQTAGMDCDNGASADASPKG